MMKATNGAPPEGFTPTPLPRRYATGRNNEFIRTYESVSTLIGPPFFFSSVHFNPRGNNFWLPNGSLTKYTP